jgi:16S rRNA (guanine(966)-N(2))-methyltransferase RsmD
MRIIQGKYKSKRIIAPKNLPVRPTTDMAKEGIFNVINNEFHFDQLTVLDLFSGTGNISYEFASRGAKSITAIDHNFNCIKYIKSMTHSLGFDQVTVIRSDVNKYILSSQNSFKLIYADPPYNMENQDQMITNILAGNLLPSNGWLIIEHDAYHKFDHISGFVQQRRYGSVHFSIFEKN